MADPFFGFGLEIYEFFLSQHVPLLLSLYESSRFMGVITILEEKI